LIVDPVVSAVSGDGNSNTEVRRALQPIVDLAARLDSATLGISLISRRERTAGTWLSAYWLARLRRGGPHCARGGESQRQRRCIRRADRGAGEKSNIGPDSGGFCYDLRQVELPACPGIFGSRVLWAEAIDGTARELLREAEADDEGEGTNPRQFLADLLANGPIQAAQVIRDAEAHGYSKRQMQRARARLGVKTDKGGCAGGGARRFPKMPGAAAMAPKVPKIPIPPVQHLQHVRTTPSALKIPCRTRSYRKVPETKRRHLRHLQRLRGGSPARTAIASKCGSSRRPHLTK